MKLYSNDGNVKAENVPVQVTQFTLPKSTIYNGLLPLLWGLLAGEGLPILLVGISFLLKYTLYGKLSFLRTTK